MLVKQWMNMEMHMFGIMHTLTDKLTIMKMRPYTTKEMGRLRRDDTQLVTRYSRWGDLKLNSIHILYHYINTTLLANLGLSISIDAEDTIPGPGKTRLPYPLQLGSGTWNFMPSLTLLGQEETWSWGVQLSGVIRLGEKNEGYTLGNVGQLTTWSAYKCNDIITLRSVSPVKDGGHRWQR